MISRFMLVSFAGNATGGAMGGLFLYKAIQLRQIRISTTLRRAQAAATVEVLAIPYAEHLDNPFPLHLSNDRPYAFL